MRKAYERAQEEADGVQAYALALYYFITGNVSLMVILIGLGLIGVGATFLNGTPAIVLGGQNGPISILNGIPEQYRTFQPVEGTVIAHRVLAGMAGVIGTTFVILGMTIYGILFANKLYARATTSA